MLVILGFCLLNSFFLLLLELSKLILSHFFKFLLNFEAVLSRSDYASLCDLLAILVVENHAHSVFEILEFFRVD